MILAAGCVHSYLVRQSLRTFTSLNVRSGECLDVHYSAVHHRRRRHHGQPLPRRGDDRRPATRAACSASSRSASACANYKKALDEGLLKIMSKMGISVLSSYRGGYNFEAVGLSRSLVAGVLPRHAVAHLRHRPERHAGEDRRAARARLRRGRDRRCRSAASTSYRRGGEPHNFEAQPHPHAAGRGRPPKSYASYKRYSRDGARACRRSTCATCWTSSPTARRSPLDEVEIASPRSASAS